MILIRGAVLVLIVFLLFSTLRNLSVIAEATPRELTNLRDALHRAVFRITLALVLTFFFWS